MYGQRKTHFLKENTRKRKFSDFLFFDTESYIVDEGKEIKMPLRLGVCVYVRRGQTGVTREVWNVFRTPEEFANIVIGRLHGKNTLHVISHNVHHDLAVTNLLNLLIKRGFVVTSLYLNGLTAIIRLKRGSQCIVIEDGSNRLRGSMKRWGEILGLPKLEIADFNDTPDDQLEAYCKRDVEILYLAHIHFFQFVNENDMGDEAYTIAGQAFNAYRHRYMKHKILIHDNEEALTLERLAYGGGRVSTFRIGTFTGEDFYYLDVNSMYPYVMKTYPFPYKLLAVFPTVTLSRLKRLVERFAVVGEFVISPTSPSIRRNTGQYILYPCYPCKVAMCTPEIEYCLRKGWIVSIGRVCVYDKAHIFTDYVNDIYDLRKRYKAGGNDVYGEICKLLLNSLYGRFGIKSRQIVPITEDVEILDGLDYIFGYGNRRLRGVYKIGDQFYTEIDRGEGENSFPAIAAHTTAYARVYLWELIELAGVENVYYTDTDSLIVNRQGFERLQGMIDNAELGKLKLEGVTDYLEIRARKDYTFGQTVKMKGIPKDAQQVDQNTYIRTVWAKLRTTLSHPEEEYHLTRQEIHLARKCYDGIPQDDGRVEPFRTPPPHLDSNPLLLYP